MAATMAATMAVATAEAEAEAAERRWSRKAETKEAEPAVIAGGGPGLTDVAGWMCGRGSFDFVRIVMLRYESVHPGEPTAIVPVIFERPTRRR